MELSSQCRPPSVTAGVTQECHLCPPVTQLLLSSGERWRWGTGHSTDGVLVCAVRDVVWEGHRARGQGEAGLEPLRTPPALTCSSPELWELPRARHCRPHLHR